MMAKSGIGFISPRGEERHGAPSSWTEGYDSDDYSSKQSVGFIQTNEESREEKPLEGIKSVKIVSANWSDTFERALNEAYDEGFTYFQGATFSNGDKEFNQILIRKTRKEI